jgi:hypothetical protein
MLSDFEGDLMGFMEIERREEILDKKYMKETSSLLQSRSYYH